MPGEIFLGVLANVLVLVLLFWTFWRLFKPMPEPPQPVQWRTDLRWTDLDETLQRELEQILQRAQAESAAWQAYRRARTRGFFISEYIPSEKVNWKREGF